MDRPLLYAITEEAMEAEPLDFPFQASSPRR